MNTDEKNLGERLELIRKSEKLSRSKFGLKVGKSEDAIYNLERGRASVSKEFIELVCNVFNINPSWLNDGVGEMYNISSAVTDITNTLDKILDSEELYDIVNKLINLTDEKIKILSDLVRVLSDNEK